MNIKDRLAIANWKHASLADVESVSQYGLVENERFTPRAKRTFRLLHEWGCHRYSSRKQNDWYFLHGTGGIDRRIARVNRLAEAIWGKP